MDAAFCHALSIGLIGLLWVSIELWED
jgi:hypothetical protein